VQPPPLVAISVLGSSFEDAEATLGRSAGDFGAPNSAAAAPAACSVVALTLSTQQVEL